MNHYHVTLILTVDMYTCYQHYHVKQSDSKTMDNQTDKTT